MNSRRATILVAFALAEAAILAPLLTVIVPMPRWLSPAGAVGLAWMCLLAVAVVWRALGRGDAPLRLQYAVSMGWLVLFGAAAVLDLSEQVRDFRPVLFDMLPGFVAAVLVWWRGVALGRSALNLDGAHLRLQLGLVLMVIYATATLFTRGYELLAAILPFTLGALIAVPLAQLESVHRSGSGRPVPMNAGWWAWTIAPSTAVLVAATTVAALLSGKSVADVAVLLLGALLFPVILLLMLIPAGVFERIAELLRQWALNMRLIAPQPLNFGDLQPQDNTAAPVLQLSQEANFAIAVAIFVALAVALVMLMGRARREERELGSAHDDFESGLRRENALAAGAEAGRSLLGLRRWLAALTVRRLYVRAGHEAGKRGFPRLNAQTPYDYLPRLCSAFPGREPEARELTEAYVAAHYGEVPDTREELDALRRAWERMRAAGGSPPALRPPRPDR